jgi:hypothetical protein
MGQTRRPFFIGCCMKVADLIAEFSKRDSLPVDVNDLLPFIAQNGHETDVEFIGVDLDPEILQGKIKIFHLREGVYGEARRCANIYYHRGHTPDWQRFICCKELLHLLDPPAAQTSAPEDIDELAEKIGLPQYMQDPLHDGLATNIDRLAEFRAAAVLFPFAARQLLVEPHANGKLDFGDIAQLADIPRKYVGLVMSPRWPKIHDYFLNS